MNTCKFLRLLKSHTPKRSVFGQYFKVTPNSIKWTDLDMEVIYYQDNDIKADKLVDLRSAARLIEPNSKIKYREDNFLLDGVSIPYLDKPASDYPDMIVGDKQHGDEFTIDAEDLAIVGKAMSKEETRYYLCGVFFGDGEIAATNGHTLNLKSVAKCNGKFIIPTCTINLLTDIGGEFKVSAFVKDDKSMMRVRFEQDNLCIISRAIDGTFPDYMRVIPIQDPKDILLEFNTKAMATIIRKASAVLEGRRAKPLVFDEQGLSIRNVGFSDKPIVLSAPLPKLGSVYFGIDIKYLAAAVANIEQKDFVMRIKDANSPICIRTGDLLQVLMPKLLFQ